MYKYERSFWETFRDKNGELECSKWFYGDEYSDEYLFNDSKACRASAIWPVKH